MIPTVDPHYPSPPTEHCPGGLGGLSRPVFIVEAGRIRPSELAGWIVRQYVQVLNVAGNRESTEPGIGARVEGFLVAMLGRVAD